MTISTKACSRCSLEKPLAEFYTKGTRRDSACKSCIKLTKRCVHAQRLRAMSPEAERLGEVAHLIARWELSRLEHYHAQIRKILQRVEQAQQNQRTKDDPIS